MFNPDSYSIRPEVQSFLRSPGQALLATDIFICNSRIDAICYLHLNCHRFKNLEELYFVFVSAAPSKITFNFPEGVRYHMLFANDLLGHVCDLKVACWLRKQPVRIALEDNNKLNLYFRSKQYLIDHKLFTLNYFERKSGYRFCIRTHKPKRHNTFFEQLKNGNPS